MQGVNGQCEQSARNYHGAIARNFYATSLRERLSCKAATPYNRIVSSALIPVGEGEDIEIEMRHSIKMAVPRQHMSEVRSYATQAAVFASKTIASVEPPRKEPDLRPLLKILRGNAGAKKKAKAEEALSVLVRGFYAKRINRRLLRKHEAGELSAEAVLVKAGVIGGRY